MVIEVVTEPLGWQSGAEPSFSCHCNINTTINRGRWGNIGAMAEIDDNMICNRLLWSIILVLVVTDDVYAFAIDGSTVFIVVELPCHDSSCGGVSGGGIVCAFLEDLILFSITILVDRMLEQRAASFGGQGEKLRSLQQQRRHWRHQQCGKVWITLIDCAFSALMTTVYDIEIVVVVNYRKNERIM